MRLLLTSVFKPYGVDDEYGRKENVMELYHNQITREQGLFSLRYHHRSFNLYLLAENVSVPSTVLDFPTMSRFIKEIKKGYDYVGISFITPNFIKAKKMCELIRRHSPKTKIILGGHGTQIPELEKLLDCDYIIRGEGISALRRLFGDPVDAPIKHPVISSADNKRVMGVPLTGKTGILLPGVGCPNACRFCSTTHMFNFKYTSFFKSTREMFDVMREIERKLGCDDFFVMDENFLKSKERALELLELMKKYNKPYYFGVFSSAEAISEVGAKFLLEIGIRFLWVGVESKRDNYEKNKGIDMKQLFSELRNHGVSILASTILFQEHHDKRTLWEDVDYTLDLRPDFVQFMQLGPLPQTQLYQDYKEKGILCEDIPYEEWHGQHRLWFRHPHFSAEESSVILRKAFLKDFHQLGPSVLRMADTYMQGYLYTKRYLDDPWLKIRNRQLESTCRRFYPLLDAMKLFMPNAATKCYARRVIDTYRRQLGPKSASQKLLTQAGYLCAIKESLKLRLFGDVRQPRTIYTKYPNPEFEFFPATLKGKLLPELPPNLLQIKQKGSLKANHICLELHGVLDSINVNGLLPRLTDFFEREKGHLTLNIVNVQKIEDNSLYNLLQQLEKFHSRLKVLYCTKRENISQAIEQIQLNLDTPLQCLGH